MNISVTGSGSCDGASNSDGGGPVNCHSKQAAAAALDKQTFARDALETTALEMRKWRDTNTCRGYYPVRHSCN
jgi:hypothetical protein